MDIWDSFTFLLVCAFPAFFLFFQEDGISRGLKETEQESFKQKKPKRERPTGIRMAAVRL